MRAGDAPSNGLVTPDGRWSSPRETLVHDLQTSLRLRILPAGVVVAALDRACGYAALTLLPRTLRC
jgi:hypothetical protein